MPRSRSRSKKYIIRRHKAKEYLCQISQRNGRRPFKYNECRKKLPKKGDFDLEYFMRSNDHDIARKICSYLDFEELKILREVSTTSYGFLNSEKSFWIRFMYHRNCEARKYLQICEAFKESLQMDNFTLKEIGKWTTLLDCIFENAEVNDIITVVSIIRKEFGQFYKFPPLSPLKIGVNLQSIRLLRVLEKFDLLDREELVEIYPKETIEIAVYQWLNSLVSTMCVEDIAERKSEYMAPILLREKALKWSECCLEVSHLLFL